MAVLIILLMFFLAILLTVKLLPRTSKTTPYKPFREAYHSEFGEEITPNSPKESVSKDFKAKVFTTPAAAFQLPEKYNEDQIALLVRDPAWLFAYWEISSTTNSSLLKTYGEDFFRNSLPVIRVYNVTISENDSAFFDIPLSEDDRRWHIQVNRDNNKFYVVLGRKKSDGSFVAILKSNIVHTPRQSFSSVIDENWLPFEKSYLLYHDLEHFSSFNFSQSRKD